MQNPELCIVSEDSLTKHWPADSWRKQPTTLQVTEKGSSQANKTQSKTGSGKTSQGQPCRYTSQTQALGTAHGHEASHPLFPLLSVPVTQQEPPGKWETS